MKKKHLLEGWEVLVKVKKQDLRVKKNSKYKRGKKKGKD